VTKKLAGTKRKAAQGILDRRVVRREKVLGSTRSQYARALIEYGTELPSVEEYAEFIAEAKHSKKAKTAKARGVYDKIYEGWGEERCKTAFSDGKKGKGTKRCKLGCTHKICDEEEHLWEHAQKMLEMVDDGDITDPGAPPRPEMLDRSIGPIVLGTKARDYEKITEKRKELHNRYMQQAEDNTEEYSPVVPLPDIAAEGEVLVGRKVEVRLNVEDEEKNTFVHCFEGTIRAFADAKAKKKWGSRKKCAVAFVEWDSELQEAAKRQQYQKRGDGAAKDWKGWPIPLDDDLYAKENKHLGWNLLSEQYVEWEAGVEREEGGRASD